MQQIKLIILLKNLTKEEFRRLGKFLNSPFYNYAIPPILLFESLKKHYPSFDSPKLTQQNIWSKVHPRKPFNSNNFWQLTSKLTRLVEQFLITIELDNQPREKQKLLIQALAPRNKKNLVKVIEEVEQEIEEKKNASITVYKEDFLHQLSLSNFHGIFNTSEAIRYEEKLLDSLELYYLHQKLKSAINLKSVEKHRNISYSFYLIPEIIQLIESDFKYQNPQLQFFSKLFQLVNDGSPELYFELKEMFSGLTNTLNREDKKFVFHHLLNYCISRYYKGEQKFEIEIFNSYRDALEFDLLIENQKISKTTFINILMYGASLGEFIWTENFIKNYSDYLHDSIKYESVVLGRGYLLFYKKDYLSTIEHLIHYQFNQKREIFRSKGLLIRCYFEMYLLDKSYYELFIYYLNSFEKYLTRDEIESQTKTSLYIIFLKNLKKLVNAINKNKFDSNFKERYSQNISNQKFNLKPWLTKRVKAIK